MKIGILGLGKLGLPCAVAMGLKGHDVMGYDLKPELMNKTFRLFR
jgi:UDP-N-acetyl-D-mannosaminuronate dehydrogenase